MTSFAQDKASDISIDFIGIQSNRAVFQITNNSKATFTYVRHEPTKSFQNSSIQIYKNEKWEDAGPFRCGTMTDEEASQYVSHPLKPAEQLLTSMSLDGTSAKPGDVIRVQVYLMKDKQFLKFESDSRITK
jgi:hypothetical protein